MDDSRKVCSVLSADDLLPENITITLKTIQHNMSKFYLLAADIERPLWQIIEQMRKAIKKNVNLFTGVRIAYNLNFNLQTMLKTGDDLFAEGIEVKNFADLLELLDFDENLNLLRSDYHVIIDDDGIDSLDNDNAANRAVAKLFQQTALLNIVGLDVQKKSEIKKSLIKTRFREKYSELRKEILDGKAFIEAKLSDGTDLSEESKERAQKIIDAFNLMLAEFEKAKARPIRIAAMGTKKAGKSVIINSLLKRDYAPTSLTLPTPNTIKYVPASPNSPLTLDYAGQERIFKTAEELRDFIAEEFEAAQQKDGKGAGLPDMTIYYPCDELNGYEVWDTPGPNVAFTEEHKKNAEKCIDVVDVCIFVMNYSTHLTDDEVAFLQKIHKIFQEKNKFYSLFITVNRIDERYNDKSEKSIDLILDYIGVRLENLTPPYKNIIIFGTSALQSFYLDEVISLIKADRLENGEDRDKLPFLGSDTIKSLTDNYRFTESITPIGFIDKARNNLYYFHGINNPTEKELYALSGIPQLWNYTQYIGGSKADLEIVDSVVGNFDRAFDEVKNSLIVTDLLQLTDEDKKYLIELAELINNLRREVVAAIDAVRPLTDTEKIYRAVENLNESVNSNRRQAQKDAVARNRNILNDSGLSPSDVELMATRGERSSAMEELNGKIAQMVFGVNKHSAERLNLVKENICNAHINSVEVAIQGAQATITQRTDEVRATVTNATAQSIMESFKTPTFPPAIDRLMTEFQQIEAGVDDEILGDSAKGSKRTEYTNETRTEYRDATRVKYKTEQRQRASRGFWEGLRSLFGKKYYETVSVAYEEKFREPYQVNYTVSHDVYDVESFKREIAKELESRISSAIEDAHDKMKVAIKDEIRKIFSNVRTQCDQICESYKRLYTDFEADINMATDDTDKHRQALERDIATFNAIKGKLQTFVDLWDIVLHGDTKE